MQNILWPVVQRRCCDQNYPLTTANLRQLFICYIHLSAEPVCFVNEYILVFIGALLDDTVKFPQRFKISRHSEIREYILP